MLGCKVVKLGKLVDCVQNKAVERTPKYVKVACSTIPGASSVEYEYSAYEKLKTTKF